MDWDQHSSDCRLTGRIHPDSVDHRQPLNCLQGEEKIHSAALTFQEETNRPEARIRPETIHRFLKVVALEKPVESSAAESAPARTRGAIGPAETAEGAAVRPRSVG
jgi:hypothetical protein